MIPTLTHLYTQYTHTHTHTHTHTSKSTDSVCAQKLSSGSHLYEFNSKLTQHNPWEPLAYACMTCMYSQTHTLAYAHSYTRTHIQAQFFPCALIQKILTVPFRWVEWLGSASERCHNCPCTRNTFHLAQSHCSCPRKECCKRESIFFFEINKQTTVNACMQVDTEEIVKTRILDQELRSSLSLSLSRSQLLPFYTYLYISKHRFTNSTYSIKSIASS